MTASMRTAGGTPPLNLRDDRYELVAHKFYLDRTELAQHIFCYLLFLVSYYH